MNSIFRQLGSIGSRSQARAGVKAANAGFAARKAALARTANRGSDWKNKRIQRGLSTSMESQKPFVQRAESMAKSRSMRQQQVKMGRNRALGIGALGSIGMMQRGPREQQTMYNRPRPTARGVGRYS